jgi:2-polyprenyl-3-methyl-5-hydroxy-6-metoxy-1,4-benzoquinol methylase
VQAPLELLCPEHREVLRHAEEALACPQGCRYPWIRGIPRFVSSNNYAAAFGRQWKAFRRTQLDSFTGTTITRDRLARCLGGSLDAVRGKLVLEAGCGAGRFTELLLRAGARVFACDLSEAVEANHENCSGKDHYFVCQADISRLPVAPQQFDLVVCLGVIQHTPDPDATIRALAANVKPGGWLVIDHYTGKTLLRPTQSALRSFLLKRSPRFTLAFCSALTSVLWPVHRLCWHMRGSRNRLLARARNTFLNLSPILDYQYAYPSLGEHLLKAWAVLDTHDALTDYYKHTRSTEEIAATLASLGLVEVNATYGGNGVEARARRPPQG